MMWRLWLYLLLFLSLTLAVVWIAVETGPRKDERGGSTVRRWLGVSSVCLFPNQGGVVTWPARGNRPSGAGCEGPASDKVETEFTVPAHVVIISGYSSQREHTKAALGGVSGGVVP